MSLYETSSRCICEGASQARQVNRWRPATTCATTYKYTPLRRPFTLTFTPRTLSATMSVDAAPVDRARWEALLRDQTTMFEATIERNESLESRVEELRACPAPYYPCTAHMGTLCRT